MHSIVFVLLPPGTTDILKKARDLLSPYDQNLELPPYKNYLTHSEVDHWKEKLGIKDLQELANRLTKEYHYDAELDEYGIYEMTTFNFKGRWDGFRPTKYLESDSERAKLWGKDLEKSICLVHQLPPDKNIPASVVTPDGMWHDIDDFGFVPRLQFEKILPGLHPQNVEPMAKWTNHVQGILTKYSNHIVLILDCHS